MQARFLPEERLKTFLEKITVGRTVYGPAAENEHVRLAKIAPGDARADGYRAVEPIKSLFFRPREDVGGYFNGARQETAAAAGRAVLMATACDLASLRLLDAIFLEGDFADPFYQALRHDTLIVSTDCGNPRETCFCTFVGGEPYPDKGYDLNLSPVHKGYVVEAQSETGAKLLEEHGRDLEAPTAPQSAAMKARRAESSTKAREMAEKAGLRTSEGLEKKIRGSGHNPLWGKAAEKCVECAACNFVCPTCHCFLLVDLQEANAFRRFRNWDACQYPAFAREASGANPRARRAQRLHGRLEKKFDFIKTNFAEWGCVGCGRCVEACAGKIDVREMLRELIDAQPV